MAPTAQAEARRQHLGAVLRLLHEGGPTRQADLAERVGVNRSTALLLVEELTGLGLASEHQPIPTGQPGRPSPLIGPARDVVAIAVEISADRVRTQLVEHGGHIRSGVELGINPTQLGPARTLRRVNDAIAALVAAAPGVRPAGAALAMHGAVDIAGHTVFAPNLGWAGASGLDRRIAAALEGPTWKHLGTRNNADLGALGELRRGAGRGHRHFVYVAAERGIGSGLVIDGELVRGATGLAGEVGHIKLPGAKARCGCGQHGCFESELGQHILLERASAGSLDELFDQAHRAEPKAARVVQTAGHALGQGLGTLLALLQPDTIILGGHLPQLLELAGTDVRRAIASTCPPQLVTEIDLVPSALGRDAAIVGAAELVFDHLFVNPAAPAASSRP